MVVSYKRNHQLPTLRHCVPLNMKTTTHLISLCCIILSIHIAAAAEAPAPVLDINGKPLLVGTQYYILPLVRGRGGGLTIGNETCPHHIVQERSEVKNGLPLTFHPTNSKKGVVRISTDHNIKFSASSGCTGESSSVVWKLDYDESIQKYLITTGGVEGNPGRETISNWFKIEKYDDKESYYKLFFCPTVCNFCKVICTDIGISIEANGVRRLTLTDTEPFRVIFKKAYSPT